MVEMWNLHCLADLDVILWSDPLANFCFIPFWADASHILFQGIMGFCWVSFSQNHRQSFIFSPFLTIDSGGITINWIVGIANLIRGINLIERGWQSRKMKISGHQTHPTFKCPTKQTFSVKYKLIIHCEAFRVGGINFSPKQFWYVFLKKKFYMNWEK